jgi:hypothetical protein
MEMEMAGARLCGRGYGWKGLLPGAVLEPQDAGLGDLAHRAVNRSTERRRQRARVGADGIRQPELFP